MPPPRRRAAAAVGPLVLGWAAVLGGAARGAEVEYAQLQGYGRFEASIQFAPADGVVSYFALLQEPAGPDGGAGSARPRESGVAFEKAGLDAAGNCWLRLRGVTGEPAAGVKTDKDICAGFHTYALEWTPERAAWLLDGEELRQEPASPLPSGPGGGASFPLSLRLAFGVRPELAAEGGGILEAQDLPVFQYVDWVRYSAWDGVGFTEAWLETFADGAPSPLRSWSPRGAGQGPAPEAERSAPGSADVPASNLSSAAALSHGCLTLRLGGEEGESGRLAVPPPAPRVSIRLNMTVLGVDPARLLSASGPGSGSSSLRSAFEEAVLQTIVQSAGGTVRAANIKLELLPPGTTIAVTLLPPDGMAATELEASLSRRRTSIGQEVVARLRALPGLASGGGIFLADWRMELEGSPLKRDLWADEP